MIVLDVEVHDEKTAQARYLVHGYDDVYWVDTINEVTEVFAQELKKINKTN